MISSGGTGSRTARRDIIEMMARGFSNSAIAEKLFISTLTVKNHVYHIYQKTGAENKVQLAQHDKFVKMSLLDYCVPGELG